MPKNFEYRFAVGEQYGPRSSSWKIECVGDEIYIFMRQLGKSMKASIHKSGEGHSGYTKSYFDNERSQANSQLIKLKSRHIDKWNGGVMLHPNLSLDFRIRIPEKDLRFFIPKNEISGKSKINWLPAPPTGKSFELAVMTSTTGAPQGTWPGKNAMKSYLVAAPHIMPCGKHLWIVYYYPNPIRLTNAEVVYQKMRAGDGHYRSSPLLPTKFDSTHRVILAFTYDQDGGRGFIEFAADRLNY